MKDTGLRDWPIQPSDEVEWEMGRQEAHWEGVR